MQVGPTVPSPIVSVHCPRYARISTVFAIAPMFVSGVNVIVIYKRFVFLLFVNATARRSSPIAMEAR